jgi:hypothetical protein
MEAPTKRFGLNECNGLVLGDFDLWRPEEATRGGNAKPDNGQVTA